MKVYAKIESKILFINEKDEKEFVKKYEKEWSVIKLETIVYDDGNILKMELLKMELLKGYDEFLRY